MSNQNIIEAAKSACKRPADLWNKVEVIDGAIYVDPRKADSAFDREAFNINRRSLREAGWKARFTGTGWVLTPPAPKADSLGAEASPIDRAKSMIAKPAAAWERATVAPDGRTVRIAADRNPHGNRELLDNLAQLRRAGWFVSEHTGPRGVEIFTVMAPVEKPAPRTLQEALQQVSPQRTPSWLEEAVEEYGALVFKQDASQHALNAATATAPKALAHGWVVNKAIRPDGKVSRVEFTPPKNLVIEDE